MWGIKSARGKRTVFLAELKKKNQPFFPFILFVISQEQSPGKLFSGGVAPPKPRDISRNHFSLQTIWLKITKYLVKMHKTKFWIESMSLNHMFCTLRGKKTQLTSRQNKLTCQHWTTGSSFVGFYIVLSCQQMLRRRTFPTLCQVRLPM